MHTSKSSSVSPEPENLLNNTATRLNSDNHKYAVTTELYIFTLP